MQRFRSAELSKKKIRATVPEPGAVDHAMGTKLQAGGNSPSYTINLESRTDDVWTVMWTDTSGNLFGSTYLFKAEVDIGDGPVEIQLQAEAGVVVVQGDPQGTSSLVQYGIGGSEAMRR